MVTTTRGSDAGVVDQLVAAGFVHLGGPFGSWEEARLVAERLADSAEGRSPLGRGMPALVAVGEFILPPEGVPARDFQLLHFDFGLPIDPHALQDVARYTALHVPLGRPAPSARTRIVPLAALLAQREWPRADALAAQLVEYGSSRGARDGSGEYVEGILARLVEAADEGGPSLPSASECLCGQELDSLEEERMHFASRGLRLQEAEVLIDLQPGQLLVLDNLAGAHGRVGRRRPKELHQLMLGHHQLRVDLQADLRDRILGAFSSVL
jgi:hypothetical protein